MYFSHLNFNDLVKQYNSFFMECLIFVLTYLGFKSGDGDWSSRSVQSEEFKAGTNTHWGVFSQLAELRHTVGRLHIFNYKNFTARLVYISCNVVLNDILWVKPIYIVHPHYK